MKKFLTIWFGELISSIGGGMSAFAMTIYALKVTNSVTAVSLITLLAFLPTVLLAPFGGFLADRYDRRLLMMIGDSFSILGLLYIVWQVDVGSTDLCPIYLGVTVSAIFSALVEPAYRVTVSDLLTKDEYAKASGMVQLAASSRYLISPALAGFFLAYFDIRFILWLDIVSFIVAVLLIFFVKKGIKTSNQAHKDQISFGETWKLTRSYKGLQSLISMMTLVCFFIGLVQVLIEPLVLNMADTQTVGVMEALCTVGLLVGSLWIGTKGIHSRHAEILAQAGFLAGIFIGLSGFVMQVWWVGIMIFLFFVTLAFVNSCADVLVRVAIPNELQGRMWGMISFITQFGTVIAYLCAGFLADHLFEPAMAEQGFLARTIGRLIGSGAGRGIGLMLIISGVGLIISSLMIGRNRSIKQINIVKER
ncbi:MFS transporter [Streptococcus dentapri]|uniref:MFS transporter n=1 Tax=Streptococcus dentapri TaxID=573564 RepID=A0ABV8D0H8_9STRE